MRRWWKPAGAVLVVALGAITFVLWRRYSDGGRTTAVPPSDAVARFREQQSASTGTPTGSAPAGRTATGRAPSGRAPNATVEPLPAPGVYVYATTGSDSVDALNGATHNYPPQTTITVAASGCGVVQRWVAADERWDETTSCAVPSGAAAATGIAMTHFTGFHRFFGGDETDDYVCDGGVRPLGAAAGTTWTATCTSSEETSIHHGTVIGAETLRVDGQPVDTVHVTVTVDDGDPKDHQTTDSWYRAGTDLVVRRTVDIATENDSAVGVVHYREHYEMQLQHLDPLH